MDYKSMKKSDPVNASFFCRVIFSAQYDFKLERFLICIQLEKRNNTSYNRRCCFYQ